MGVLTRIRVGVLAVALLLVGVQGCSEQATVGPEQAAIRTFQVVDTVCGKIVDCDPPSGTLWSRFLSAQFSVSNPAPHCDELLDGFDEVVNGSKLAMYDHDELTAAGYDEDVYAVWDPHTDVIAFADDAVQLIIAQFVALAFHEVAHVNGQYHH